MVRVNDESRDTRWTSLVECAEACESGGDAPEVLADPAEVDGGVSSGKRDRRAEILRRSGWSSDVESPVPTGCVASVRYVGGKDCR